MMATTGFSNNLKPILAQSVRGQAGLESSEIGQVNRPVNVQVQTSAVHAKAASWPGHATWKVGEVVKIDIAVTVTVAARVAFPAGPKGRDLAV